MNSSPSKLAIGACAFSILVMLSACGGGGGSGPGIGDPILLGISADGLSDPLWPPPSAEGCPSNIPHNARLRFVFGGVLDPMNVAATASSSIRIMSNVQGSVVIQPGMFEVQDDPTLPSGNRRILVFQPDLTPLGTPAEQAGYRPGTAYTIEVLAAGQPGAGLIVGPGVLRSPAQACFVSCDGAPGSAGCSVDPVPGAAFIEVTTPETADFSPDPAIDPSMIERISLFCSEPLQTSTITSSTFVITRNGGLPVTHQTQVFAAGSPEAGASGTRIDLVLSSGFAPGTEYVVTLGTPILDFGQHPLELYDPSQSSSQRRVFRTGSGAFCESPPLVEDFSDTINRAGTTGVARWDGDGLARTVYDETYFGNAAFGPLILSSATTLDTGMPMMTAPNGQVAYADGTWNLTILVVNLGVAVRVVGATRPAHFRCTGFANIQGTINASAGLDSLAAPGSFNQGPRPGAFNNGGSAGPFIVAGGIGGPGAGRGGNASQADQGSTQIRTIRAESGHGASQGGFINSQDANFFGGGEGGAGGQFPPSGVPGQLGGVGGAGGSARLGGDVGAARTAMFAGCLLNASSVQDVSDATGPLASFLPPISIASAGSGGGGGGDRFEPNPFVGSQLQDEQGGGGGGGGGGVRISSIGPISVSGGILCNGAPGAAGNALCAGGGGGGSGGQIWLQTPTSIEMAPTTLVAVQPGLGAQLCSNYQSGSGGAGTIQLEDSDGMIFGLSGLPNTFSLPFPFAGGFTGTLTSQFRDTGYVAPEFIEASAVQSLGNLVGASLEIRFQGAHESATGQPDLTTVSTLVLASEIGQLNGFRFIRFVVEISYPLPPLSTPTSILPSVDEIRIRYSTTRCSALPG